MKIIYFLIGLCMFQFCLNAQHLNREISTVNQYPYLLGKIDKSGLERENYASWFNANYEDYQPNNTIISEFASKLKSYEIKLFMGTWCGDSKREVPRFYKILETANFPMKQLTLVAVSREPKMYKQSPEHEDAGLNIHRVPTVIFFKNGKEVNRIVEQPVLSLEEDIKKIIITNDYEPNNKIVSVIDEILKSKGTKGLKRESEKLLKAYEGKVSNMYELNTYGRILHGTNRTEEAIAVYRFNTILFPNDSKTYMSLANILGASGQKNKAIKVLENALLKLPNNKDLKENLKAIKSN
ncbi:thioredoxin family protein [Winogradskyella ursingii]|uniref:thioredoxin family protein n=1 Tax=Winogradskyella ursingii TaxID=2686079 RepID=UPI0015CCD831|nr:thioredoxin family protein [Winogradskyella ursingii]